MHVQPQNSGRRTGREAATDESERTGQRLCCVYAERGGGVGWPGRPHTARIGIQVEDAGNRAGPGECATKGKSKKPGHVHRAVQDGETAFAEEGGYAAKGKIKKTSKLHVQAPAGVVYVPEEEKREWPEHPELLCPPREELGQREEDEV